MTGAALQNRQTRMMIYDILLNFFTYGFLGWCTEVAFAAVWQRKFVNRGFLNGPLCPIYGIGVTAVVVLLEPYTDHLLVLYAASALLVTVLEYITGALLEKVFHHRWWDYSKMPMNIKGYVCIPFSLIWGAACVVIVKMIHPVISKVLSLLPKGLGIFLLAVMCILLIVDISVTAAGILKWNRHLDKMEEIAVELRSLSDQIGENIYQNTINGLKKQEETRKRIEELKQKYEEMLEGQNRTGRRLIKAFPKMEPGKHGDLLAELKKKKTDRP